MYKVFQIDREIGTGTLTECIEFIASQLSQFHPEQVTAKEAVEFGYSITKQ